MISCRNVSSRDVWCVQSHPMGRQGPQYQGEGSMATTKQGNGTVGSVLVIGGGIAGMQASLDLANSGYYVHLLEKGPAIGGGMAQLDKTFPTNECAM